MLAATLFPALLHLGHDRQNVIQSLVLNHSGPMNRAQGIEGSVGQDGSLMHDLQATIGIVSDT